LLWRGKKIAGAAQRRNRIGLLIQGSVQPPPVGPERAHWQSAMCEVASEHWGLRWQIAQPDAAVIGRGTELAASKYSQASYTERR
jgi:hypothetical protein